MHRPGANQADMQPADFVCDFCHTPWDGAFPMVEGHRGSHICGRCIAVAYTETDLHSPAQAAAPRKCTLCLAEKTDPGWESPVTGAWACRTCIKRSAGRLHKDPDWDWRKPVQGGEDADDD
jgi:hypothetical protein